MENTNYKLGDYNKLEVIKFTDFGLYLLAGEEEILMPNKYIPEGTKIGDILEAFIYLDSEDRPLATTLVPFAKVGDWAALKAVDAGKSGVFLDWGLEKDLLVPFSEQHKRMEVGKTYLVRVLIDEETYRIYATARLEQFLDLPDETLQEGQEVSLIVWEFTSLGTKMIINEKFQGVVYQNENFKNLFVGDKINGYVKKIRDDGKVDLSLRKQGIAETSDAKSVILQALALAENHFLPLHDDSSPQQIQWELQMSKKTFKKAVGGLLKEQKITLTDKGIKLL
jgi:hypothetical protein